jgi:hypothetical protein
MSMGSDSARDTLRSVGHRKMDKLENFAVSNKMMHIHKSGYANVIW